MLFNSMDFAIFFPIVFALYWLLARSRYHYQNVLILVASYVFYGWWDWRFLFLVFISSCLDFIVGRKIAKVKSQKLRKSLLILSLGVNLGSLGFFKYYDFFISSFIESFTLLGMTLDIPNLNVILPVGISFYTFQTLSYTIDIYKKNLEPANDFVAFLTFVSFFPQLVAGPIERASNLLPQFLKQREFSYNQCIDGVKRIIYGFFVKLVVADNIAVFVNRIFSNVEELTLPNLAIALFFFGIQIYCDFSGYSHIALGTSKLLGFELMENFRFPYFAKSIGDFWQRWHISLSTWFRDYVYIPLGGNRSSGYLWSFNIFITFTVSGLWHGANWTFVIWGMLHSLVYFMEVSIHRIFKPRPSLFNTLLGWFGVNLMVFFAWFFFRIENMGQTLPTFNNALSQPYSLKATGGNSLDLLISSGFIVFLFLVEFRSFRQDTIIPKFRRFNALFYHLLLQLVLLFGAFENQSAFIYFQF
ncbi:MAG: MBOAT family O-acyltransferase [Bacteroidota bacterium]